MIHDNICQLGSIKILIYVNSNISSMTKQHFLKLNTRLKAKIYNKNIMVKN